MLFVSRLRIFFFTFVSLFQVLFGNAQQLQTVDCEREFDQWGEVTLVFPNPGRAVLTELTHVISIDQVKEEWVYAYANRMEFRRFLDFHIDYQLLPHSSVENPHMRNRVPESLPASWDFYPTYDAYIAMMLQFQTNYPSLCQVDTLSVLPSGRLLLAVRISDNVNTEENEPEFLYTSSIHGNELTGYVLMLRLIDYLLSNYGSLPKITNLLDQTEIWINPLANPDGTYHGGNNTVSGAIRYNGNYVDLNRNYPDPQNGPHPDGNAWQPETVAFMDFADDHHFTMSANFHGGAEVFNYPWDTWSQLPADNDWWYAVGRAYADTIHLYSQASYFSDLDNGVTNGYDWYEINGGRQDFMNYYHYCREVTLEISDINIPAASTLPTYWNYQYRSMLNYLNEALFGIRGLVTDSLTAAPLIAKVSISGYDTDNSFVYSSLPYGNYYRYLYPGTYNLTFEADGYTSKTMSGAGVSQGLSTLLNVQLLPVTGTIQGVLTYDNSFSTPLDSVTVYLLDSAGAILSADTTNAQGVFQFIEVIPGTYSFTFFTNKTEGGINATDALQALRHFVQMITLTGLKARAADVNLSGTINSVDALMIQKRFVGMINGFPAAPWLFETENAIIGAGMNNLLLKGICSGDVNGSYIPD